MIFKFWQKRRVQALNYRARLREIGCAPDFFMRILFRADKNLGLQHAHFRDMVIT